MNAEAVAELQEAVKFSGGSPTCVANLARAYTASGKKERRGDVAERSEEALDPWPS